MSTVFTRKIKVALFAIAGTVALLTVNFAFVWLHPPTPAVAVMYHAQCVTVHSDRPLRVYRFTQNPKLVLAALEQELSGTRYVREKSAFGDATANWAINDTGEQILFSSGPHMMFTEKNAATCEIVWAAIL